MKNVGKESGMSLVELMVGIAIALILLTGVLTMMLRVSTSGAESVQATRLNQQLRGTMDFITKDLQRSGYVDWYDVWDDDNDSTPSAMGTLTDANSDGSVDILDYYQVVTPAIRRFGEIRMMSFPTPGVATGTATTCTASCDCVLFSYDLNEDGLQGIGSASGGVAGQNSTNFELFGFRWNAGAIEQRTSIDSASDWANCNSAPSSGWQDITDAGINITNLAMSSPLGVTTAFDSTVYVIDPDGSPPPVMATSCTPSVAGSYPAAGDTLCLWRRNIALVLEGQLVDDAGVRLELINSVKVKNDYLQTQP